MLRAITEATASVPQDAPALPMRLKVLSLVYGVDQSIICMPGNGQYLRNHI